MATRAFLDQDDDMDDYVLIDARAVILDMPDDLKTTSAVRPPMRGADPGVELGRLPQPFALSQPLAMRGDVRQRLITAASSSVSMWERLGRSLRRVWAPSKRP